MNVEWNEFADIHFDAPPESLGRGFQRLTSYIGAHISFVAVLADLCRHFASDNRGAVAFKTDGSESFGRFAYLTHDRFRRFLVLNPGCHRSGSDSYTVTMVISHSKVAVTR